MTALIPSCNDDYFFQLATFVSAGLAVGYTYCKGGIMATNPRAAQPLSVWEAQLFYPMDRTAQSGNPLSQLDSLIWTALRRG